MKANLRMRKIDIENERKYENKKNTPGIEPRKYQGKFYKAVANEISWCDNNTITYIESANVLEIGCSNGELATIYTKHCRGYTGIDLSNVAISKANERKLMNASFLIGDAHQLPFDDESFDVVIVNGLLHHLDLATSLSEISRVLKVNGKLIAREPLGTNPLINVYRFLTPGARTPDERPFTFNDLRIIKIKFNLHQDYYFGLLNLVNAFINIKGLKVITNSLDRILARSILKYFFWQIYFVATKK